MIQTSITKIGGLYKTAQETMCFLNTFTPCNLSEPAVKFYNSKMRDYGQLMEILLFFCSLPQKNFRFGKDAMQ